MTEVDVVTAPFVISTEQSEWRDLNTFSQKICINLQIFLFIIKISRNFAHKIRESIPKADPFWIIFKSKALLTSWLSVDYAYTLG